MILSIIIHGSILLIFSSQKISENQSHLLLWRKRIIYLRHIKKEKNSMRLVNFCLLSSIVCLTCSDYQRLEVGKTEWIVCRVMHIRKKDSWMAEIHQIPEHVAVQLWRILVHRKNLWLTWMGMIVDVRWPMMFVFVNTERTWKCEQVRAIKDRFRTSTIGPLDTEKSKKL